MLANSKIAENLKLLTEAYIPYQFVPLTGFELIKEFCSKFELPEAKLVGGNIVIGDLNSKLILVTHLDEISFGFETIDKDGGYLSSYHSYEDNLGANLKIMGIRNKKPAVIGEGVLEEKEGKLFCKTNAQILLGDRIVYDYKTHIDGDIVSAKTIDGRAGVLAQLLAIKENKNITVVLTDGEEGNPEGYFGRNFARLLPLIPKDSVICFTYGVYPKDQEKLGYNKAPKEAFIIPHSGGGKGLIVNPLRFAWLRDEMVPKALNLGIDVKISEVYSSRGDDWSVVTSLNTTHEPDAFFVDFGAWGSGAHQIPIEIDINTIKNVANLCILLGKELNV